MLCLTPVVLLSWCNFTLAMQWQGRSQQTLDNHAALQTKSSLTRFLESLVDPTMICPNLRLILYR